MSFSKKSVMEINKTAPDGTVVGTDLVSVTTIFAVKSNYITETGAYAELHTSYDGAKWQLYKSYPFELDVSSGVLPFVQAEAQIKDSEDFSS